MAMAYHAMLSMLSFPLPLHLHTHGADRATMITRNGGGGGQGGPGG